MGDALRQSLLVVVQRRDLFLVLLVLGVEVGKPGVNLPNEHPGFGLVVLGADSLELQLELQFGSFVLERCLGFLDPRFNVLEDLVLLLEALQLLPGRIAGAVLEVSDQGLQSLLEDGRGDLLAFVGLIGRDFLGAFQGLRQLALALADTGFQAFDLLRLCLKEGSDQIVVGDEAVVPADGDDRFEIEADLLPPVHEDAGALEFVQHLLGNQTVFEGDEQFMNAPRASCWRDVLPCSASIAVGRSRPGQPSTRLRGPRSGR